MTEDKQLTDMLDEKLASVNAQVREQIDELKKQFSSLNQEQLQVIDERIAAGLKPITKKLDDYSTEHDRRARAHSDRLKTVEITVASHAMQVAEIKEIAKSNAQAIKINTETVNKISLNVDNLTTMMENLQRLFVSQNTETNEAKLEATRAHKRVDKLQDNLPKLITSMGAIENGVALLRTQQDSTSRALAVMQGEYAELMQAAMDWRRFKAFMASRAGAVTVGALGVVGLDAFGVVAWQDVMHGVMRFIG